VSLTTKLYFLGALTLSIASADSLTVVNPNFSTVAVQCSDGTAYQSVGGNCETPDFLQQPFNTSVGIGWQFAAIPRGGGGDGLTEPNSTFEPPPFTGLPFSQAILLQGDKARVWQTLVGFIPGVQYTLSFYLGSRYTSGSYDGNQTVEAIIDGQPVTLLGYGYSDVPAKIGTGTATASGNATVEGRIPQTAFGTFGLQLVGSISGTVASGAISISPVLLLSPATGTIGETVTLTGFGFAAGEKVNVNWISPSTSLGNSTAYANGTFPTLTFAIPVGAPPGPNAVIATGQRRGAIATAQIVVK
jgi:hypothetical protein